MKLFDISWLDFYRRLDVWEQLALSTRQVFAHLKPNTAARIEEFGDDLQLLIDAEFVKIYVDGQRAKLHTNLHPFARAIRAMCRHDILERPSAEVLQDYLRDHYTNAEQSALMPDGRSYYRNSNDLIRDARSVAWINDFLSLENIEQAREWESLRQQSGYYYQRASEEPILNNNKEITAAQSIIRRFMSSAEPVAFRDLPLRFKQLGLPTLAAATYAGIRYLLLFPSMRHDYMTPMINIWPAISRRLNRPKAKPPKTIKPDQIFHCAYLMEDMTTVLVGASGEPPRVRSSDLALFAKAQTQLESNLTSIPEWLAQLPVSGHAPGERIKAAVDFLQGFRFIETRGAHGKDLRFEPTTEAREWLGKSSRDRLKTILDRLKPDRQKNQPVKHRNLPGDVGIDADGAEDAARVARCVVVLPELYDEDDGDDYYDYDAPYVSYAHENRLSFLPPTVSWGVDPVRDLEIPTALIDAYGSLTRRRFVPFSQFVEFQTQQANPLLSRRTGAKPVRVQIEWSCRKPTDEEAEDIWGKLLVDFFRLRLLPLGGVQVGTVAATGDFCIALTDAGRYLLDLAKDFEYGQRYDQKGGIVVQSNFDIVFLSPAPLAEAIIARFADRRANGTGTLFKITKKSIFTAASCSMTAEQVLDTLGDLCTKAIPNNVTREVRDWFDQCGRVAIKSTLLIRCPNEQVAARVLAAGGKKLTLVSDTVVELTDRKFRAPLVNKLKEAGVFVDQSLEPAPPKPKRRRQW